jgi:hypothetical protein
MDSPDQAFHVLDGSTFSVGDLSSGSVTTAGLAVNGGSHVAIRQLTVASGSAVVDVGSALHVMRSFTQTGAGSLTLVAGRMAIGEAPPATDGELSIGSGGELLAEGIVMGQVANLGGAISPNGAAAGLLQVNGNLTTQAELEFGLSGLSAGVDHDRIDITGHTELGGVMRVETIAGFVPSPGDAYEVLKYGTRSGVISSIDNGTGFAGLILSLIYDDTQGLATLTVDAATGDVDLNGSVDRSDVVQLLGNLGRADEVRWFDGDLDGDGAVALADLVVLQSHLPGAGSPDLHSAAVPEPTSCGLAIMAAAIWVSRRRPTKLRFRHR